MRSSKLFNVIRDLDLREMSKLEGFFIDLKKVLDHTNLLEELS
jgi:hypothetical protein